MKTKSRTLDEVSRRGFERLRNEDPELFDLLQREYERQANVLCLVASSSVADWSVLACEGMMVTNVTAEGYPGARFHAGCKVIDGIEQLAIDRANIAFKSKYANVQAHSASTANQIVMFSVLKPGDTILGMDLNAGGHLTHGAKVSFSGQWFNAVAYGVDQDSRIDFAQVEELARRHRPKLIICGTTSYPRTVDFARFRAIADEVGALLLADITHIAGLVVSGIHASPINHAHFTTTCTHKQLYGPRGGLILMGKDYDVVPPGATKPLHELVQKSVFPLIQGAPPLNGIAAKARALARAVTPEFNILMDRIVKTAREFARQLMKRGVRVITGGTDNHIVLVDVATHYNLTGIIAERALEDCGIIVNKNKIPGETKNVRVTSGIRIGTNTIAARQFRPAEVQVGVELIDKVLSSITVISESEYRLDHQMQCSVSSEVEQLCSRFPLPESQSD